MVDHLVPAPYRRIPLTLLTIGGFSLASALVLSSCNLADGLRDVGSSLVSPDAALIDAPGRKLASGRFRSLLIDGSLDEGGNVIAMQDLDSGSQTVVIPYPQGKSCVVTPAVNFDRLSSRVDVGLPGIFSVQRDADDTGRGEIFFSDFSCNEVYPALQRAYMPRVLFPALSPRGVLAIDDQGALQLLEPLKNEPTPVASDVSRASTSGSYLWTIEAEKLTVRDGDLSVVARLGNKVSAYVPSAGTRISAAFSDADGLWAWSEKDDAQLVSETGCSPTFLSNDTLAFFDPCDERKLRIFTLGERVGVDDEFVTLDGPAGVTAHDRSKVSWGQTDQSSELLFLLGEAGSSTGKLALVQLPPGADVNSGHIALSHTILSDDRAAISAQAYFTAYDGVSGTLVDLERDDDGLITGLKEIAQGVAQLPGGSAYSGRGVLRNFADGVGTLSIIEKSGADADLTMIDLATAVPIQDQSVEADTLRFAFIGKLESENIGTLYLTPTGDGPPERAQAISKHVFRNTARFLSQPHGLAYLYKEPDSEFAELRVYLIDSELTTRIHPQVSEYRVVPWPSPGILYAVPEGDDQGLWYAKAR